MRRNTICLRVEINHWLFRRILRSSESAKANEVTQSDRRHVGLSLMRQHDERYLSIIAAVKGSEAEKKLAVPFLPKVGLICARMKIRVYALESQTRAIISDSSAGDPRTGRTVQEVSSARSPYRRSAGAASGVAEGQCRRNIITVDMTYFGT